MYIVYISWQEDCDKLNIKMQDIFTLLIIVIIKLCNCLLLRYLCLDLSLREH